MSEVLCASSTLLTAVSLHRYSFNTKFYFFLPLFSLYTLGHGVQNIICGQTETEIGRKLQ